jgi:hypothetical protein
MSEPLEYRRLDAMQRSPLSPLGRVVVGVPQAKILELSVTYPPNPLDGRPDPRIDQTILSEISDREKELIHDHFRVSRNIEIDLTFNAFGPARADYEAKHPTFDGDNGKKFWVEPIQR